MARPRRPRRLLINENTLGLQRTSSDRCGFCSLNKAQRKGGALCQVDIPSTSLKAGPPRGVPYQWLFQVTLKRRPLKPDSRVIAVSTRQAHRHCSAAFFIMSRNPAALSGRDRWRGCWSFRCGHYVGQTFNAGDRELCLLPRIGDPAVKHRHERKSEPLGNNC